VAGRQGGSGRELTRDSECNSETEKSGFEECHIAPGVRPEKGHLTPEVKMANEIVCDVYGTSCPPAFLKPALNGIYGRPSLSSGLSLWTRSLLSCCWLA
jgi:hypothetical protein